LVDAGAKLTIATDNMHADMVEVMRWALAMGRVQRGLVEESWQPEHILYAATEGGADAMGLAGQIGAVSPGYRADMVLLEMRRPHLVPHNDPLGTIMHTAHGRDVAHVIVEGAVWLTSAATSLTVVTGVFFSTSSSLAVGLAALLGLRLSGAC
jgi:5-methylthioadenosine/S-adenosylhomocysteine deaminase